MSVTFPLGFTASGATAGIKPSGKPDLCLIARDAATDGGATGCAMVFTANAVTGAPVIVGKRRRAAVLSGALATPRAVLVNAGNSNAATGQQGVADAEACCAAAAALLACGSEGVVPSSTGVIGRALPVGKIIAALPGLAGSLARGESADAAAAAAIMTTDTVPKAARAEYRETAPGQTRTIRLGAIAKGSGMIAPRLDSAFAPPAASATMLAFVTTDAPIASVALQRAAEAACSGSFDRVNVDNHPSCSDTVIVLASGAAGGPPITLGTEAYDRFAKALRGVCEDLARQVIIDGEGATRIFRISIRGASSDDAARRMCAEVVSSPLVKCAIHGQDPNWGRIVTAAGNAGVWFDTAHASLTIGGVEVYRSGVPLGEALGDPRLKGAMAGKEVLLELVVGHGPGAWWMIGCDLSKDYVTINAEYTT